MIKSSAPGDELAISADWLQRTRVIAPASTALARKQEQFSLEELELQADLLPEEAARLGIRCLDGEQPHGRLVHENSADFWGERL